MSKEPTTNGTIDRERARTIWLLKQDAPRCSFCKNKATHRYGDNISPIHLCCEGCYEAFGYGMVIGATKHAILIGGDVGDWASAVDWYGQERLDKWEKMATKLFERG